MGNLDLGQTHTALTSSSTKLRLAQLHLIQERLSRKGRASNTIVSYSRTLEPYTDFISFAEISPKLLPSLLQLFFNTHSYYYDKASRRAVERCIRTVFRCGAPAELLSGFVNAINTETKKPGIAASSAFVLVEYCSILLQEISGTSYWEIWGSEILMSNAQALELCLGESSRSNVKHTALVATRRGLRKAFSQDTSQDIIEEALQSLCTKGSQPSARNAVMLGVVAGVCARNPSLKVILEGKKAEIYAFYNREIIGSRATAPVHIACALGDFFADFTTKNDVEQEIVPPLEKALLRAPEIVLNDLVTPLFQSISDSIDLSNTLQTKLLKPLMSNIKSTNAAIRQGALSAFKAAVLKCHDAVVVAKIANEILVPLKSGTAEQRANYAEMLAMLPLSKSNCASVANSIAAVASKEANEAALASETSAILYYLLHSIQTGTNVEKSVIDTFVKGISDKKITIKKLWTIRLGQLFWDVRDPEVMSSKLTSLSEATIAGLLVIWQEVTANPIPAAQSGLVTAAYVFLGISFSKLALTSSSNVETALKKAQIRSHSLAMEPKPSFLLNPRTYGKLSSHDDFVWFTRALFAFSQEIDSLEPESASAIAWSQAVMFCICSSNVEPAVRRQACQLLSSTYVRYPEKLAKIIIAGLWQWMQSIELGEKDSAAAAAKTENQNLHLVLRSICLTPAEIAQIGGQVPKAVIQDQMVSLLVLSRPELLPRINWIELCLRVEVDPGDLAKTLGDALIQQILDITDFSETVSIACTCTCTLGIWLIYTQGVCAKIQSGQICSLQCRRRACFRCA